MRYDPRGIRDDEDLEALLIEYFSSAVSLYNQHSNIELKIVACNWTEDARNWELYATYTLEGSDGAVYFVDKTYGLDDNDIFDDASIDEDVENLKNIVNSSESSNGIAVFAAEEDSTEEDFSGDFDSDFADSDDSFNDSLDQLSDQIEDLQDSVDEITEDDPSIDVDNNIDNHYIVECDRCHGIFISAVVESGQKVEKISGTCPLCDHETDQYVKWIVRKAFADEEEA